MKTVHLFKRSTMMTLVLLLALIQLAIKHDLPKAEAALIPLNQNLLLNPGFETLTNGFPNSWNAYKGWTNSSQYPSASAARTGNVGININMIEPGNPGVFQLVPVEEGATYEISVWQRSNNIDGKGLRFKIEFYNAATMGASAYVGDYSPNGIVDKTGNWVQNVIQVEAPQGAKFAYVLIRSHGAGLLNVDDAYFAKIKQPQAVTLNTNEIFYYSDKTAGTVKADIRMSADYYPERKLDFKISNTNTGEVIASQNDTPITKIISWAFDPSRMTLKDEYKVEATLKNAEGEVLEHQENKIYRFNRPTSLAADGSYIVNGQPFFPIYPYYATFADYPNLPGEGYNTVFGTSGGDVARITEWLDNAQASGLKIIIPLDKNHLLKEFYDYIATIVAATKNHPALLAWQMVDEPAGKYPLEEMAEVYRIVRTLDDVHPIQVVEGNPSFFERNGKVVDLLATDPYPIAGKPIAMVGDYIRQAAAGVHGDKPVGAVLQTFFQAGNPFYGQLPSIDEVRNMAYQSLIAGTKQIAYYSYRKSDSPLYAGLMQFKQEYPLLDALSRLPKLNEQRADDTEWATYQKGGDLYAIVLNHSAVTKTVTVPLPNRGYTGELLYGAPTQQLGVLDLTLPVTIGTHQAFVYKLSRDTIAPTAVVSYSNTQPTTDSVIAAITPSESVTITNNGGSSSYTFLYNGSFTFEFVDASGNQGTATATVQNITAKSTAKPGKPTLSDDNGYDTGLLDGKYNVTMNLYYGDNGRIYKLYENDVLIDTKLLTDNSPNAQTASTAISGKPNGTYRYYAELTNAYGTTRSDTHVVTVTKASPEKAVLSNDNWDGDGSFKVNMDMWWGTNGATYNLYENGVLIFTQPLMEHTPNAQSVVTALTTRAIGNYEYRAELVNYAGASSSDTMTVHVTK